MYFDYDPKGNTKLALQEGQRDVKIDRLYGIVWLTAHFPSYKIFNVKLLHFAKTDAAASAAALLVRAS